MVILAKLTTLKSFYARKKDNNKIKQTKRITILIHFYEMNQNSKAQKLVIISKNGQGRAPSRLKTLIATRKGLMVTKIA